MIQEIKNLRAVALECASRTGTENVIQRAEDYYQWLIEECDVSRMIHEKAACFFDERIIKFAQDGKGFTIQPLGIDVRFNKTESKLGCFFRDSEPSI